MKVLAAFAVAFAFAAALVLGAAPVSATNDVSCPPTLGSWNLFSSGQSSRDNLGDWYLGCTYEPEAGSGEFGQVSVVAMWSDTGEVGQGGCIEDFPEEPLPDGGVRGTLRSGTNQATVDYTIPSQFDKQTALDLARQLLATTEPLAVPCGGSTAPGPGKVTCPPTLEGLPLFSDPDELASQREADDQLAAGGIGHASCSYLGENLPGGYLNNSLLSVSWLIERTGETQALLGISPCESETVSRRPGPLSVASSTKEVTSNASWSRSEPEPESFVVALTDLVKQAEPLAIRCDTGAGSGGSGSASDQTGGDDAAGPTTTTGTGIPTDAEVLIAAGLIMTLLGIGGAIGPYMGRSGDAPEPPEPIPEMPPLPDAPTIPGWPVTESNVEFLDHLVRDEVIDHLAHPPPMAPPQGPPPSAPPPVPPVDLGPLQDHFSSTVHDKLEEGWFVRNPDVIRKIMNNFMTPELLWDPHSGQCGEFATFGEQWVADFVNTNHPGAIVDHLWMEYRPGTYEGMSGETAKIVDSFMPNHAATRIILPDGQRVMVDFWEYMGRSQGSSPRLVPEQEWVEKWGHDLFGKVNRSADENRIKQFVEHMGEHDGLAAARDIMAKEGMGSNADLLIRSWRRSPW